MIEQQIVIFHRSKQNAQESLANQQAFIEAYIKYLPITAIDYMTGDSHQAQKISELISKNEYCKIKVIINSYLSQKEFEQHYNMYTYFKLLKSLDMADLYLMDSEGKLYREIENIKGVEL